MKVDDRSPVTIATTGKQSLLDKDGTLIPFLTTLGDNMIACNCEYCLDFITAFKRFNQGFGFVRSIVHERTPSNHELPRKTTPTAMAWFLLMGPMLMPSNLACFLSKQVAS